MRTIFTVVRMCAYVHTFYSATIVHVFPHSAYLFVILTLLEHIALTCKFHVQWVVIVCVVELYECQYCTAVIMKRVVNLTVLEMGLNSSHKHLSNLFNPYK